MGIRKLGCGEGHSFHTVCACSFKGGAAAKPKDCSMGTGWMADGTATAAAGRCCAMLRYAEAKLKSKCAVCSTAKPAKA